MAPPQPQAEHASTRRRSCEEVVWRQCGDDASLAAAAEEARSRCCSSSTAASCGRATVRIRRRAGRSFSSLPPTAPPTPPCSSATVHSAPSLVRAPCRASGGRLRAPPSAATSPLNVHVAPGVGCASAPGCGASTKLLFSPPRGLMAPGALIRRLLGDRGRSLSRRSTGSRSSSNSRSFSTYDVESTAASRRCTGAAVPQRADGRARAMSLERPVVGHQDR